MAKRKLEEDEYFIISSTVIVTYNTGSSLSLLKNHLHEYGSDWTWAEVCNDLLNDAENFYPKKSDILTVHLSNSLNGNEVFKPDVNETLRVVKEFDKTLKFVTFKITRDDDGNNNSEAENNNKSIKSAFDMMMQSSSVKRPAMLRTDTGKFTAKDQLFNDLVKEMNECGDHFPQTLSDSAVSKQVMVVVNAVWYVSGNMKTIDDRADCCSDVKHIPARYLPYDGANDYKKKKHKKPTLSSKELLVQSQCLFSLASQSMSQNWTTRGDLEMLAVSFESYARYLEKSNERQKHRQSKLTPPRQLDVNVSVLHNVKADIIPDKYKQLDMAINELDLFQPLFFDENIHVAGRFKFVNRDQRFKYFSNLALSVDTHCLRYDPGAGLGCLSVLWKIPLNESSEVIFKRDTEIYENMKVKLPEYHTRAMRKEFSEQYGNISGTNIPPHVLRSIYSTLTNDASSDQNPEIDQRVRLAILGSEPDLVVDLRHLNKGRPSDTFDIFFEHLENEIQDCIAADERRHNIEHVSKYLSVRDLIQQVSQKLPQGTPIPSESTVLLAFVPKNSHTNVSKLYKGRIPVRMKVQTRQLRASHQDDHFCAALFKYARNYAVNNRSDCTFVCMDDKAKVDFGEPGMFSSSGVRGKKSIVPMNSQLSCLDHDVQCKGSLTPSVILDVDIPESLSDSFYQGQVSLTMKDSVFQPSTPFRHITELQHVLENKGEKTPVLFMYTDGGPDHRVTYHSVKLSLIVLFKRLGLELLVALRTAPGHSWANPAERIMSMLNIAFQNTALAREESDTDTEHALRACGSMNEIRKKAERVQGLKDKWITSVQPVVNLLGDRAKRMILKQKPFHVHTAATDDLVEMAEAEVTLIDPVINIGQYQQQKLKQAKTYKEFLEKHCLERHYCFQVRRCQDEACCNPPATKLWQWLPDPVLDQDGQHYKPLESVLGFETRDDDRPSSKKQTISAVAEEQQGCKNSLLVAQNVRLFVPCTECDKPRCIYSKNKLTARETRSLKHNLEKFDYSCGSVITVDGDTLQGRVFVRLQMSCQSHVEFPYYASNIGRPDICAHCAEPEAQRNPELLTKFRIVLPVCEQCITVHKKDIPHRCPIKK